MTLSAKNFDNNLIIVRGGGDLASGTIAKLYNSGFSVLILEIEAPSAIRRNVAFSEAVYDGTQTIEDITCYLAKNISQAKTFLAEGKLTLLVDPEATALTSLKPFALVDAIIAKKNLGTTLSMAPITVALGPGFTAKVDVDAVIETKRGHNLGRILYEGSAAPNSGIPGKIEGYDKERVIHSPAKGILRNVCHVTDTVKKGQVIATIELTEETYFEADSVSNSDPASISGTDLGTKIIPVYATLDGLLRGLIRDGYPVTKGFKIADIDPRISEYNNCFTISDKARCIAGGVLEAILFLKKERNL